MVKIGDIAKVTGYSITTVSKALNGYPDISQKTKDIITAKAKEMGYIPNANARSLVMKRSFTIGVLLDDITDYGVEHPFFAGLLQEFRGMVEKRGFDVLFISKDLGKSHVDSYLNHCRQRNVDGVLVLCTDVDSQGVKELLASNIPTVVFDIPRDDFNCVYSDHYQGAKEAVAYLIHLGHHKIAHIYGVDTTHAGYERRRAYMDSLHEHGISLRADYMVDGGYFEFERGKAAMEQLLRLSDPPSAVFVAGDIMAMGAMKSCYENHIRIPDDVSIIGFDNIKLLRWSAPRLTSVGQNYHLIGKECGKMLIELIEDVSYKGFMKVKIPTHLVMGETCKRIIRSGGRP